MNSSEKALNRLIGLIDVCLTVAAFLFAYLLRSLLSLNNPLFGLSSYIWVLYLFVPCLLVSLYLFGFYGSRKTERGLPKKLLQAFLICALIASAAVFFTRDDLFSRSLFFLFLGLDFLFLMIEKSVLRGLLLRKIRENAGAIRVLAVGDPNTAEAAMRAYRENQHLIFHVIGCVSLNDRSGLGNVRDLQALIIEHTADQVFFFPSAEWAGKLEPYLRQCEELGVTARVVLDWYSMPLSKTVLSDFDGAPMLTFHTVSLNQTQLMLKRLLDLIGGVIGLVLTGLVTLVAAPLIKLDSKGPVFYSQRRVGQNGREFTIYKFRSMYADADQRLEELKSQNELSGAVFKMKNDPRITRVGKVLRRMSIDELPQFWNVLKGEMSLVGTRPPTVSEVAEYQNYHRRRLSIKPGLTGMWQTSGRNEISDFEEIYRLDVFYIDHWSLWLDIRLLARTVRIVLTGRGAE